MQHLQQQQQQQHHNTSGPQQLQQSEQKCNKLILRIQDSESLNQSRPQEEHKEEPEQQQ
ncbi:GL15153 [Drosophila persimilis]|uniref:GL15153 n=1 Tax=Drosophila persimilis TaxID=7234 RepID=B4H3R7_DROPE|nr:GL15153 [Drosophila persimilis]